MSNKVFQHSKHKELWYWLAENPKCEKDDWPQWVFNGGTIKYNTQHCFACEYALCEDLNQCACPKCPVEWTGRKRCFDDNAEFELWSHSVNPQERTRLSLVIAELPVREGVVCE